MHPELFRIGPLIVYTYGALFAGGITLAAFLASRRAACIGWKGQEVFDFVVAAAMAAIVGARLAYGTEHADYYFSDPMAILRIWEGGLIFHGGIVTGMIYIGLVAYRRKQSFFALMDFLVPYIALAHGMGRIGCFFNGCCFGKPFEGPWAVAFPFLDHPVYPTQIYSALIGFVLFGLLLRVDGRKSFQGQTMCTYFMVYALARFGIEFLRGDKAHDVFSWATQTQLVFVFVFVMAAATFLFLRQKKS